MFAKGKAGQSGASAAILWIALGLAVSRADEPVSGESPPAGTIAFSSLAPRGWDVYLTDLETGATRRLTDHPALDYNATFSPDGRHVLFVSQRDGNMELYRLEVEGGRLTRLTDEFALDDHPAPSPDGSQLAFVSTREPSSQPGRADNAVYIMQLDGSGVQRLTPSDAADYSPTWSPNGDWIAAASGSGRSAGTDIHVMRTRENRSMAVGLRGQGLGRRLSNSAAWPTSHPQQPQFGPREFTRITEEPTDHWNPSISPDGRYVLYHKQTPETMTPDVELWGNPPPGQRSTTTGGNRRRSSLN